MIVLFLFSFKPLVLQSPFVELMPPDDGSAMDATVAAAAVGGGTWAVKNFATAHSITSGDDDCLGSINILPLKLLDTDIMSHNREHTFFFRKSRCL